MTGPNSGCVARSNQGITIFSLSGYLNHEYLLVLRQALEKALAAGERRFVLDFRGTEIINSPGIAVLLEIGSLVTEDHGGALAVFGLTPHLHTILEISAFFCFATVKPDEAEALAALR